MADANDKTDALVALLKRARDKLDCYYKHTAGEYPGGEPNQTLFPALDKALAEQPAEGDGAVGYLNISEASEGDGWQDCVTMTAAGRALPVGRHAIYTSPPAASVDVEGLRERAERLEAALRYAIDNPSFDSATFDSIARAALAGGEAASA